MPSLQASYYRLIMATDCITTCYLENNPKQMSPRRGDILDLSAPIGGIQVPQLSQSPLLEACG